MRSIFDRPEEEDLMILAERFEMLKVMDGKADAERSLLRNAYDSNTTDEVGCNNTCSVSFTSSTNSIAALQLADDLIETNHDNHESEGETIGNNTSNSLGNCNSNIAATKNLTATIASPVATTKTSSSNPQRTSALQPPTVSPRKSFFSPKRMSSPFDNVGRFINKKMGESDVGRLINKELLKFDHTERTKINEDVHGVASLCPDESEPGMVDRALRDLDRALENLPAKDQTPAYRKCRSMYPESYIHQRDFKLRFLRAELFRVHKAAVRLAHCLQNFLEWWGEYALQRPIRLSDFSKQEHKVFAAGRIQVLPFRDRGGRRVLVGFPSRDHQFFEASTRAKIWIYLWWVAGYCVETQRKGMVIIIVQDETVCDTKASKNSSNSNSKTKSSGSNNDSDSDNDNDSDINNNTRVNMTFSKNYMERSRGLPGRMVALHLCTPDTPYFAVLRSYFAAFIGMDRCRLRIHVGQTIENRYQLSGFGISLDQMPLTESGKIKTVNFRKWIQMQRNVESVMFDKNPTDRRFSHTIECPLSNDVLFKPSQSLMCHPGNAQFRSLVESKHLQHSYAPTREAKVEVTKGVMQSVQETGGRYLIWDKTLGWIELTDEKQIYAKIAVFFRNSKITAKTNLQSTKSSTYIFAGESCYNREDNLSEGCFKRRKMAVPFFCSI